MALCRYVEYRFSSQSRGSFPHENGAQLQDTSMEYDIISLLVCESCVLLCRYVAAAIKSLRMYTPPPRPDRSLLLHEATRVCHVTNISHRCTAKGRLLGSFPASQTQGGPQADRADLFGVLYKIALTACTAKPTAFRERLRDIVRKTKNSVKQEQRVQRPR